MPKSKNRKNHKDKVKRRRGRIEQRVNIFKKERNKKIEEIKKVLEEAKNGKSNDNQEEE